MSSFTFVGEALTIVLNNQSLFTAEDMYSEWKDWIVQGDNAKYERAFDTVGGDDVGNNQEIAPYFFLRNNSGWRVKMPAQNGELVMSGNLFARDPDQAMFIQSDGYDSFLRLEVSTRAVVITVETAALSPSEAAQINKISTILADTDELQRNQSSFATATGFSTFDPETDPVANVTLVATTTTNTDMRGTNGANTVVPDNAEIAEITTQLGTINDVVDDILVDTGGILTAQTDLVEFDFAGLSTFDPTEDEVITNEASRLASKADVSNLPTNAGLTVEQAAKLDEIAAIKASTDLIPALL